MELLSTFWCIFFPVSLSFLAPLPLSIFLSLWLGLYNTQFSIQLSHIMYFEHLTCHYIVFENKNFNKCMIFHNRFVHMCLCVLPQCVHRYTHTHTNTAHSKAECIGDCSKGAECWSTNLTKQNRLIIARTVWESVEFRDWQTFKGKSRLIATLEMWLF